MKTEMSSSEYHGTLSSSPFVIRQNKQFTICAESSELYVTPFTTREDDDDDDAEPMGKRSYSNDTDSKSDAHDEHNGEERTSEIRKILGRSHKIMTSSAVFPVYERYDGCANSAMATFDVENMER